MSEEKKDDRLLLRIELRKPKPGWPYWIPMLVVGLVILIVAAFTVVLKDSTLDYPSCWMGVGVTILLAGIAIHYKSTINDT